MPDYWYSGGTASTTRMPLKSARWVQMLCIYYNNGRVLQGIALAVGDRVVRVAVKDSDDAVEFRLINQVWVSEDCEVVKIAFVERFAPVESAEASQLETLFRFQSQPLAVQRVM